MEKLYRITYVKTETIPDENGNEMTETIPRTIDSTESNLEMYKKYICDNKVEIIGEPILITPPRTPQEEITDLKNTVDFLLTTLIPSLMGGM